MRHATLFGLALLLVACPPSPVPPGVRTVTRYAVHPMLTTPLGNHVDPSDQTLPAAYLAKVDAVVSQTFACLHVQPRALTLKIAADWHPNCDGTQQVLPIQVYGCDPNKPAPSAPECQNAPCFWRAILQDDGTIVTTPSLYVVKDPIVRLVTGKQNIWTDPALAGCAAPSTGPLDTW